MGLRLDPLEGVPGQRPQYGFWPVLPKIIWEMLLGGPIYLGGSRAGLGGGWTPPPEAFKRGLVHCGLTCCRWIRSLCLVRRRCWRGSCQTCTGCWTPTPRPAAPWTWRTCWCTSPSATVSRHWSDSAFWSDTTQATPHVLNAQFCAYLLWHHLFGERCSLHNDLCSTASPHRGQEVQLVHMGVYSGASLGRTN